jgi:exopolysaccharide biosynthesis polyprenyl glycosylphosphotransferase
MATSVTVKTFPGFVNGKKAKMGTLEVEVAAHDLVIDEHHFVRMLRVERKRTERSGKPFMLMLIEAQDQFDASGVIGEVVAAVETSTRETDSLGWYQTGSILGVLFTELGTADQAILETIIDKVASSLRERLDPEQASKIHVSYHLYPEKIDNRSKGSTDIRLYPDLPRMAAKKRVAHVAKRVLDVTGSLFAILMLSPVFLFLVAAVKLTSKGPVLFRQTRIGQYGKPFTFLKFRSMYANNNSKIHEEYVKKLIAGKGDKQADGKNGSFKLTNDPRITPIGRLIRRTSLDELPQFFNVLMGEMSLVGPRPPVPYEYEAYDVWHRDRMMEVRPGITGLWQVTGRSKTTFDEMVRLDLHYAGSWSILMDLKILIQTPMAVFSGDGAY